MSSRRGNMSSPSLDESPTTGTEHSESEDGASRTSEDDVSSDDDDRSSSSSAYSSDEMFEDNGEEHMALTIRECEKSLDDIKKQQQQLRDGTHEEFLTLFKELETQRQKQMTVFKLWRDNKINSIVKEYNKKCRQVQKDLNDHRTDFTEYMIGKLNKKQKDLEFKITSLELSFGMRSKKTIMTKKLEKRVNDSVLPVHLRDTYVSPPTIQYMLNEHDIEEDVKAIHAILASASTTKAESHELIQGTSASIGKARNSEEQEGFIVDKKGARIEKGKLLLHDDWFNRGDPVFVEGLQVPKFAGVISYIGFESIWVSKNAAYVKICIKLSMLTSAKVWLTKRRISA